MRNNCYKQCKSLPSLIVGADDHQRLLTMAERLPGPAARLGDQLLAELGRARVVGQDQLPEHVVRMGSTVSFSTPDGFNRSFRLVYPGQTDISRGRVSIFTPIGTALIGLSEGQSMPWTARDGREVPLTVQRVDQKA